MFKLLHPRLYVASIYDIDLAKLSHRGITGLILDLDNTLVGWNRPEVTGELSNWLARVRGCGLDMCIVSNNMTERVERFARQVGVMSIPRAGKPRRRSFSLAMRKMGSHARTTAVVGDQIFTDILGGNRLELFTILVRPLDDREFWTTRMVRRVERALIRRHSASVGVPQRSVPWRGRE